MRRAGSRRGSSFTPLGLDIPDIYPWLTPWASLFCRFPDRLFLVLQTIHLPRTPGPGASEARRHHRAPSLPASAHRVDPLASLLQQSQGGSLSRAVVRLSGLAGCSHEYWEVLDSCYQVSRNIAQHLSQKFATKTIHMLDLQRPTTEKPACQRSARHSDGDRLDHPQPDGDAD